MKAIGWIIAALVGLVVLYFFTRRPVPVASSSATIAALNRQAAAAQGNTVAGVIDSSGKAIGTILGGLSGLFGDSSGGTDEADAALAI